MLSYKKQSGAAMIITIIILLTLTITATSLYSIAIQESETITSDENTSLILHAADSCIDESVSWLIKTAKTAVPCGSVETGKICNTINGKTMDSWRGSTELVKQKDKNARRKYRCDITRLESVAESSGDGSGKIDGDVKYDASDDTGISSTAVSYYRIRSYACEGMKGNSCTPGPNTSTKATDYRAIVEAVVKIY